MGGKGISDGVQIGAGGRTLKSASASRGIPFLGGLARSLLREAQDPLEAVEKYLASWEGEEGEEAGGVF